MNASDRITPAALMVTASVCAVLLMVGGGVVWNFVSTDELDGDGVALLLGVIAAANGLLARTWREAGPTQVTTAPGDTLDVTPVPDEPVDSRTRITLRPTDAA